MYTTIVNETLIFYESWLIKPNTFKQKYLELSQVGGAATHHVQLFHRVQSEDVGGRHSVGASRAVHLDVVDLSIVTKANLENVA